MNRLLFILLLLASGAHGAEPSAEELAKKLQNPIASLMSFPFQLNYDQDLGVDRNGERYLLNIQPVLPFSISEDTNLISRTILPVVRVDDVVPGDSRVSGMGDVVQSLFFSPKASTAGGWIWGAGPVFLLPTATEDALGGEKWGAGPTAVALRQAGAWTYGALVNHIWDVAGDDDRADINATFVQPFVSRTWPNGASLAFNSETTLDWENNTETIPLNAILSKVVRIGGTTWSLGVGARYYLESPDNGPEGWGWRLQATLLVPK